MKASHTHTHTHATIHFFPIQNVLKQNPKAFFKDEKQKLNITLTRFSPSVNTRVYVLYEHNFHIQNIPLIKRKLLIYICEFKHCTSLLFERIQQIFMKSFLKNQVVRVERVGVCLGTENNIGYNIRFIVLLRNFTVVWNQP